MIVVADAAPLHYLVIIGHTDVLPNIFKKVTIPPAVAAELSTQDTRRGAFVDFKFARMAGKERCTRPPF